MRARGNGTAQRYRRAVLLVSGFVSVAVTVGVTPAASAATTPDADAVVLVGRTVHDYTGDRMPDGGCRYRGQEVVEPGSIPAGMVVVEREIAHDLVLCTLTTERGFAPRSAGAEESGQSTDLVSDALGALGGGVTAAATTRRAYHKTFYEDPPGIDVNSVRAEVEWTSDGVCVDTFASDHRGEWSWFTQSGWYRTRDAFNTYKDCAGASTAVEGRFQNDLFCRALVGPVWSLIWGSDASTWTEYDPTFIKGQLNGTYFMQWTAYKGGGCSNLLTFQREHGYM